MRDDLALAICKRHAGPLSQAGVLDTLDGGWLLIGLVGANDPDADTKKERNFDPGQPRNPAGQSNGGQWASAGGGSGSTAPTRASDLDQHEGSRDADSQVTDVSDTSMQVGPTITSALMSDSAPGTREGNGDARNLDVQFVPPMQIFPLPGWPANPLQPLPKQYQYRQSLPNLTDDSTAIYNLPGGLTGPQKDWCMKRWENAVDFCDDNWRKPGYSATGKGFGRTWYECVRGLVEQRCGGNKVGDSADGFPEGDLN